MSLKKGVLVMNEPVNWVKNRRECTIESIFLEPLLQQIQRDVEEAGRDFELVEGSDSFVVRLKSNKRRCVTFKLMETEVCVYPYEGVPFIIFEHWYDNVAQCGLLLKSDEEGPIDIELWQISQRALVGLFFDD